MLSLRKYLIAGLLIWLPIAATVFVIRLLINLLDRLILLVPPDWRPEAVLGFSVPGLFGLVLAVVVLILTGMLVTNLFGRRLVALWEELINRIPLVRSIYVSVKQVTETLFHDENKSFRQVVLIEYPRQGIYSLGFLTGKALRSADAKTRAPLVSVFVPTTPNPTSGFIVMVPKPDITALDISVEEAFKYIISLGVISADGESEAVPPPPGSRPESADKLATKPADS
ncbi:MAG: DUF502 domain-containing protein [Gammaproteobacteria bacterium]